MGAHHNSEFHQIFMKRKSPKTSWHACMHLGSTYINFMCQNSTPKHVEIDFSTTNSTTWPGSYNGRWKENE